MMGERLTPRNISYFGQGQLEPCSGCELNKDNCGQQRSVSTPGKETDVFCIKYGPIEIIDFSLQDKARKHVLVTIEAPIKEKFIRIKRNGQPSANREISSAAEAAL